MSLSLPAYEKMRIEAQATIHDLMLQVQNLSLELRPFRLDDLGLLPTLLWHFSTHRSIGLFGMRERARLLNWELTIESPPGTGTRILAELFFLISGRIYRHT